MILFNPVDCSPPGSSVDGISQAKILEWVAISSSRDPSDLGIELGSPAWQADSSPTELSGKSLCFMGLDKQPIHRYIFRHSSFTALNILCALPALFLSLILW